MWLPLPRVVADVEAGGPLVTAMGGINALANNRLLKEMNEIKKQYLPTTLGAEAASKLAYSSFMAPQFMAKLMQDPKFLGNMSEEQKAAFKDMIINAAGRPQGLNALNESIKNREMEAPSNDSILGHTWNALKNLFGTHGTNASPNPMQKQNMPRPRNPIANTLNPSQNIGREEPENYSGQSPAEEGVNTEEVDAQNEWIRSPEGQIEIDKYNRGEPSKFPLSKEDALAWKAQREASNPMEMTLTKGAKSIPQGTYAKNAGEFEGIEQQGKEAGKYRAEAVNKIGEQQEALSNSGAVIDELVDDFTKPEFVALRAEFPYLQNMQLEAASHVDDPRVQAMIGKVIGDLESFKAATVSSFKGQTLKREFEFADKLKPTQNDTVYTALGKIEALKSLHDIAETKNALISGYLQKNNMNLPEAIAKANKMVDVKGIREKVKELTEPLHAFKSNKTGLTMYLTLPRAKEMGLSTQSVGIKPGEANAR